MSQEQDFFLWKVLDATTRCIGGCQRTSFLSLFSSGVSSGSGGATGAASLDLTAAFFGLLLSFADLGSFGSLAAFGVDVPFAAFGVLFNLIRGFFGAESGCC